MTPRYSVILLIAILSASFQPRAYGQDASVQKFVRFMLDEVEVEGVVTGNRVERIRRLSDGATLKIRAIPLNEVEPLPPTKPTHVFGVAMNFKGPDYDPAKKPEVPQLFFKSHTAVIAHNDAILIPHGHDAAVAEAEMVVVIGKPGKNISVEDASEYVGGIACGNDVSGGGWGEDFSTWRVKGTDTFAPCGPYLVTGLDPGNLDLELRINGEVIQKGNTRDLVHTVDEVIGCISRYVKLERGDLIYMGTPGPIEPIKPGDVVEVEVEGVGTLRNTVNRAP